MKRLLILISIALLAVLLLMMIKNEYARFLPSAGYGMSEIIQKKKIDYLFLGASTFRRGLDIEELEKLPGNTYILSYNGNQPITMYMTLEYLLNQGVTFDHLFIDFYPYTAAAKPALSDTTLLLDTNLSFKLDLWESLSHEEAASLQDFQKRLTTFYELFISSNNATILWWPIHQKVNRSRNRHGGLRNMQKDHGRTTDDLEKLKVFGKRDGMQPSQIEAYQKIVELAQQNHIQLYFLEIPKYHKLYHDPDYQDFSKQILTSLTDSSAYQIILANQIPLDQHDSDYFNDLVHLSGFGAHTYTKMLVERLRNEQ